MSNMNIGFTGTRHSLTQQQAFALNNVLLELWVNPDTEFHHGACKGADSWAGTEAWGLNYHVVSHPGKSAHGGDNEWLCDIALEHSCEVRETKAHFARNRDIVDQTDLLIACQGYMEPITQATKGGTAYTVNYARKCGKPVWIIKPDGGVTKEQA